ncbi:MAG: amidohydrolase family protein [Planctomycetes bacterium]|nr:amidohydrolase family protein [Planctomycetota bacterium]
MRRERFGIFLAFLLGSSAATAIAKEPVAVRAGEVIPITSPAIRNAVILIRDGRIEKVGPAEEVEVPWNARVIVAREGVVLPGLIEAHAVRGIDRANERARVVPFVSVEDSIDPSAIEFERAIREGVSAMHIIPGNDTLIGGYGLVVRPRGGTIDAMRVAPGAMKISFAPRQGNRMAHAAELRRALDEFDEYARRKIAEKEKTAEPAAEKILPRPDLSKLPPSEELEPNRRAMADLLRGRMRAFLACETPGDVERAIALAKDRGLEAALVLGPETWKAADRIAEAKLPVVIDPDILVWERDRDRDREILRVVPVILSRAGVRFAFQSDGRSPIAGRLVALAATAVAYGMERDAALRAITLVPAEILGLGDRKGAIEPGRDADLAILTGDPFSATTWVDKVIIDGEIAYDRTQDEALKRLLERRTEDF